MKEFNFFDINELNNDDLDIIYENIDNFINQISDFRNILMICGDYPGYGGAATNCNNIHNFLSKNKFNIYTIYFNYIKGIDAKYEDGINYCIIDKNDISTKIINLNINPDLIILKSPVIKIINLKKYYDCPIFYLIAGIYNNTLNKYYYDIKSLEEQNFYIYKPVIDQIRISDKSFCNSNHTKDILKKFYQLDTYIFYSSFIQYYKSYIRNDINFNNRKYNFALIVSNFDNRKIKNIQTSINLLKNKKKVILIGKNASKYKHLGFECIELCSYNNMHKYYKQIKYIIQNSYYESCSNVKIEGLFNNCKIYKQ